MRISAVSIRQMTKLIVWRAVSWLTYVAIGAAILHELASFTSRQSIVLSAMAGLFLQQLARQARQRIAISIFPHWKPLLELLTIDPVLQSADAAAEYRDVTLTYLQPALWFNNMSRQFSASPSSSIQINVTGFYFGEPRLSWHVSRKGVSFYLYLPSKLGGVAADQVWQRVAASGLLIRDDRILLGEFPYEALQVAWASDRSWGWFFFGEGAERRARSLLGSAGWKESSLGWSSEWVSVAIRQINQAAA